MRQVPVGRVGRAHGVDGSFYVDDPEHDFAEGSELSVAGQPTRVERRRGTDARPLIRIALVADRETVASIRGQPLLAPAAEAPLAEGEWLSEDLVGCRVGRLGEVRRVVRAPSCDLLVVGDDESLVPFVRDAITRVDLARRAIEVDERFLGLDRE